MLFPSCWFSVVCQQCVALIATDGLSYSLPTSFSLPPTDSFTPAAASSSILPAVCLLPYLLPSPPSIFFSFYKATFLLYLLQKLRLLVCCQSWSAVIRNWSPLTLYYEMYESLRVLREFKSVKFVSHKFLIIDVLFEGLKCLMQSFYLKWIEFKAFQN